MIFFVVVALFLVALQICVNDAKFRETDEIAMCCVPVKRL